MLKYCVLLHGTMFCMLHHCVSISFFTNHLSTFICIYGVYVSVPVRIEPVRVVRGSVRIDVCFEQFEPIIKFINPNR